MVGETRTLVLNEYSDWVELSFKAGPGVKVSGIAKFYLISTKPDVNLYMTPIHIDPENPAMPISHPEVYAIYLAKKQGKYATLGLAEDTWSLNNRVIDEKVFYDQAMSIYEEREQMFLDAVAQSKKGLVTTVFDTTDRIQHMFYRYLDPTHPANAGKDTEQWKDAIGQVYEKADGLLGKVAHLFDDPDTVLMVISDHGFTNFRRGVNINSWLRDNGYLFLKDENARTSGEWFDGVDWERTRGLRARPDGPLHQPKGPRTLGHRRRGCRVPRALRGTRRQARADDRPGQRPELRAPGDDVAKILRRAVPIRRARPARRMARWLPQQLGVRGGPGDRGRRLRQHQELVRRPLRRPRHRTRRLLLQPGDHDRTPALDRHSRHDDCSSSARRSRDTCRAR